jgi:hypothetical protein
VLLEGSRLLEQRLRRRETAFLEARQREVQEDVDLLLRIGSRAARVLRQRLLEERRGVGELMDRSVLVDRLLAGLARAAGPFARFAGQQSRPGEIVEQLRLFAGIPGVRRLPQAGEEQRRVARAADAAQKERELLFGEPQVTLRLDALGDLDCLVDLGERRAEVPFAFGEQAAVVAEEIARLTGRVRRKGESRERRAGRREVARAELAIDLRRLLVDVRDEVALAGGDRSLGARFGKGERPGGGPALGRHAHVDLPRARREGQREALSPLHRLAHRVHLPAVDAQLDPILARRLDPESKLALRAQDAHVGGREHGAAAGVFDGCRRCGRRGAAGEAARERHGQSGSREVTH